MFENFKLLINEMCVFKLKVKNFSEVPLIKAKFIKIGDKYKENFFNCVTFHCTNYFVKTSFVIYQEKSLIESIINFNKKWILFSYLVLISYVIIEA